MKMIQKKRIKKKEKESPVIQEEVMERKRIEQRAQEEEEEADMGLVLEGKEEEVTELLLDTEIDLGRNIMNQVGKRKGERVLLN